MGTFTEQDPAAARLALVKDWVQSRCGSGVELVPASTDASFRRYFRIQCGGHSRIVMDAPPQQEDCHPFIDIARRLASAGVHVPEIIDADLEQGLLLLGDLGQQTYLDALNEDNAETLYADALETLLKMQLGAQADGLPVYDAVRLRQELGLFPDWYLRHHLALELGVAETAELESVFDILVTQIVAQPQVFVHRDYMPRNLMVSNPNPGVLDFQDAVLGPISYDLLSLCKDAFISWPEARVQSWVADYQAAACAQGLPVAADREQFRRDLDWVGVQRHLKVLGIFARIRYRDGKPHYLQDAPRFVSYLLPVVARYPQLAGLDDLLRRHVLPPLEPI